MKRDLFIHGTWVLVAVGAFAVGKYDSNPNEEASNDPSAENRESLTSSTRRKASRGGSTDGVDGTAKGDATFPGGSTTVIVAEDMSELVRRTLAITDPIERQRQFAELLASLTAENAEAAVKALREAPRSSRWGYGQEFSLLTMAWGRLDGPAALAFASGLEGRTKEWTMGTALSGWASEDPAAAIARVEGIEDEGERSRLTIGLVSGLARNDISAATEYVYNLAENDAPMTDRYMDTVVRQQLTQGLDAATAWTDSLPNGELKGSALGRVADEYARLDPEQAATWVTQYAEQDFATNAIGEISEEWAERDPVAAIEWTESLPEGEGRRRAVAEAVYEWAGDNLTEAGNYVSALQPGEERDSAVSSYTRRVVNENPEVAVEWALSIQGEELRQETTARTIREWRERDPAAAQAFIDDAQLPESVIQEINRPRERDRWGRYR
ncbi:MAG: hypothetical protein PVJ98_01250 [Akkermansiaceae bacterium]|jgi:hypothetical protein